MGRADLQALVTIVDFNKTALSLAENRAKKLGLDNVATHCGDVAAFRSAAIPPVWPPIATAQ